MDLRDVCAKVRRCVNACLTGREAQIIRLRYGLGSQVPSPVGNRAAVRQSRFYVSHTEKALEKLLIEYEKI